MLDCMYEQHLWQRWSVGIARKKKKKKKKKKKDGLDSLYRTLMHLFCSDLAVRQTEQAGRSDTEVKTVPWRLPLPSVPLGNQETVGNGVKQVKREIWENEKRSGNALGRLNRGPCGSVAHRPPRSHPSPPHIFKSTSLARAPLSSRTQDNALYSLITLSNWRALRSERRVLLKNQSTWKFFFSIRCRTHWRARAGGETVFVGVSREKKGEIETSE